MDITQNEIDFLRGLFSRLNQVRLEARNSNFIVKYEDPDFFIFAVIKVRGDSFVILDKEPEIVGFLEEAKLNRLGPGPHYEIMTFHKEGITSDDAVDLLRRYMMKAESDKERYLIIVDSIKSCNLDNHTRIVPDKSEQEQIEDLERERNVEDNPVEIPSANEESDVEDNSTKAGHRHEGFDTMPGSRPEIKISLFFRFLFSIQLSLDRIIDWAKSWFDGKRGSVDGGLDKTASWINEKKDSSKISLKESSAHGKIGILVIIIIVAFVIFLYTIGNTIDGEITSLQKWANDFMGESNVGDKEWSLMNLLASIISGLIWLFLSLYLLFCKIISSEKNNALKTKQEK